MILVVMMWEVIYLMCELLQKQIIFPVQQNVGLVITLPFIM